MIVFLTTFPHCAYSDAVNWFHGILSTSISIVHDLIERYPEDDDDGEESDKHK